MSWSQPVDGRRALRCGGPEHSTSASRAHAVKCDAEGIGSATDQPDGIRRRDQVEWTPPRGSLRQLSRCGGSSRVHHTTAIELLPLYAPRRRHAGQCRTPSRIAGDPSILAKNSLGKASTIRSRPGPDLAGDVTGRPGESRSGAFERLFAGSCDSRNERTERDVSLNLSYASLSTEESRWNESSCTVE